MRTGKRLLLAGVVCMSGVIAAQGLRGAPAGDDDLAQQIFDVMIKLPANQPDHRPVHAKGIVCEGTFTAAAAAKMLSNAGHLQGPAAAVTVRFSDGASDPMIPDNSPNAGPRGMAIRFKLGGDASTDIVAMSHNGFVVSDGAAFLALQKAVVATDPAKPHPWPVEEFLSTRPAALKFVQDNATLSESFATCGFFANHAFVFVNKDGGKQAFRYKIVPAAGLHELTADQAKEKSANYLMDDIKARLGKGAVEYRLMAQLPNPGDTTKDSTVVWPEDRKTVELGTISLKSVVADSEKASRELAFDPTNLTDGIELSDDPLPELRSKVYALSVARRNGAAK